MNGIAVFTAARRLTLSVLLAGGLLAALNGCGGGKIRPGQGEFWWDDENKVRMEDYRLPADAEAPEPEREGAVPSPLMAQPERRPRPAPRTSTTSESTATLTPRGNR